VTGHHHADPAALGVVAPVVLGVAALAYLAAVLAVRRRGRSWPGSRVALWLLGLLAAAAAVTGPLPDRMDFASHMVGHVLLGMLAPLLLVSGTPVALALRALPVGGARRLSRVLRTAPVVVLTHPVVAALLSVGGLWVLYRTGLHEASMQDPGLELAVQAHVLVAGYLFTAALVGRDPAPHRPRLGGRAAVLVAAVAAHNVLAKALVADPPSGVSATDALAGGQVMYYLGAPVEVALFVLLGVEWAAWDRRVRRRPAPPLDHRLSRCRGAWPAWPGSPGSAGSGAAARRAGRSAPRDRRSAPGSPTG
jgi:putative membrane protein